MNGNYKNNFRSQWRKEGFKKEGELNLSLKAAEDAERRREMGTLPNEGVGGAMGAKLEAGLQAEGSAWPRAHRLRANSSLRKSI